MKRYLVAYESKGNLDKGSVIVPAENVAEAQTKFFEWLKSQELYSHMWRLNVEFTEHEEIQFPLIE